MLNKPQKSKSEGFTIIEVLIVLAIAGLIMLIVLLAVPALQRNSRNTSRKNDVGRIASAIQTVLSNNNGDMAAVTNGNGATNLQPQLKGLSYYAQTDVIAPNAAVTFPYNPTNSTNQDRVYVIKAAVCGTGGNAGKAISGSSRQVAIVYSVETNILQCQEL